MSKPKPRLRRKPRSTKRSMTTTEFALFSYKRVWNGSGDGDSSDRKSGGSFWIVMALLAGAAAALYFGANPDQVVQVLKAYWRSPPPWSRGFGNN